MSKVRVYQLAKDLDMPSKVLIEKLKDLSLEISNHMSTLEDSEVEMILELLTDSEDTKTIETPKVPVVEVKLESDEAVKTSDLKELDSIEVFEALDDQQVEKNESKANTKNRKQKKVNKNMASWKQREDVEVKLNEVIIIPEMVTVAEFANRIGKSANEIIMKLMAQGTMATINQEIPFELAELLAVDFGIEITVEVPEDYAVSYELDFEDEAKDLTPRAPVVTVMGHVDHGKTSLLDAIRDTSVTEGEAGGITQHIGASEVSLNGNRIVFLDTPGHEAFTTLRARGAKVTDIAILVVAADDGVMPQTIEAIDHAKAAGVPIIVAINKIDKINANPDRVKQELSERGILIEEWGGDVISVPVSALKREGIDQLLEMVLLTAEMQELKANAKRAAVGTIIEAKVDKGRGAVATVLVEKGTLKIGEPIIAGSTYGRVRAMYDFLGKEIKVAGPITAVEITGLNAVPEAGDKFYVTQDDRMARLVSEKMQTQLREQNLNVNKHISLEDLFDQIQAGKIKDLNIIIKADAHGSIEALKGTLVKLTNDEVNVKVIHSNVGTITESDVLLASASNALIIGFNVRPSSTVSRAAEKEGVSLKTYRIIYEAIQDVESAMLGMLDPEYREVVLGRVQVRDTFKVPNVGVICGAYVTEGKVARNAGVRVIRDGIVIHEGKISSLRRFKDDAKEVATGYECGIGIENFNNIKVDDEIEAFIIEEIKRTKK